MSGTDPTQQALNAASAMKTIVDLAANQPEFNEAGTNLAKSAKTVTALINNCLLPIAAVNYAFDKGKQYFENQFKTDLGQATAAIPPENIIEPKASIVAPILQGLTFAHSEAELKQMYLNLLKSAMDNRVSSQAHPFFSDAIKQLTSQEARLLPAILGAEALPISRIIALSAPPGHTPPWERVGYYVLSTHIMGVMDQETQQPITVADFPAMVENWMRLKLVEVTYSEEIADGNQYTWVKSRPEYMQAVKDRGEDKIVVVKGIIRATPFGNQFRRVVLQ